MTPEILLTSFVAGLFYAFVPSPATLAALNLSATFGRAACARFLACHLLGDLVWAVFANIAIIGVSQFGPLLFNILGVVCGMYLIWLGVKALKRNGSAQRALIDTPWKSGLMFGFTNPKAHPFAVAIFTAVFSRFETTMTFQYAAPLVLAAFAGFSVATIGVVIWTGLPITRQAFMRYGRWITRATGLIFIAFGAKSIADATGNIRARN